MKALTVALTLALIAPLRDDFVDDFLRGRALEAAPAPALDSRDVLGNPGVHVVARGAERGSFEEEFRARRTLDRAR